MPERTGKTPSLQSSKVVVGSMDVKALYPNVKTKKLMKKIQEAVKICDLEFDNIDKEFLTKFVSVLTRGKSGNNEADEFLQTPQNRTTLNSFLRKRSERQFLGPPLRNHTQMEKKHLKILLGIAAARSTQVVMENHFFTISKKIFRQKDGSPIGLDMSVEGASIYMLLWDRDFLQKLKKLGIHVDLYKRYVDDTLVILRSIRKGWKFCKRKKKMVFDPDEDDEMEDDARTFSVLRDIANEVDKDIQMTSEYPSGHENGRLPVLDLCLEVVNNKIHFYFFSKPMINPYTIMYRSAIPAKVKKDTLFQEGLRRLRNTCPEAPDQEIKDVLRTYMNTLRISGYDQ